MKKRFHIEITGKCNIRCKYCYNSKFNAVEEVSNQLTIDEIEQLIKQAADMGCTTYIFSGGEPFVRQDIDKIISFCPEDSKVSAITNCMLINEEVLDKISKYPQFKELKISWDGFNSHNSIRVGSDYNKIINNIKLIHEKLPDCNIIINTIINKYSITELLDLYEKLKELGIKHWRIDMPFNSGRYEENRDDLSEVDFEDIILTYRDLLKKYFEDGKPMILEIFNVYKSQIKLVDYHDFDLDAHPCAYYNNTITVRPNADLTFCPSLGFKIANWRDTHSLEEAVKTAEQHEYMNVKIRNIDQCVNCRYLKLCGGGCRADAVSWLNNENEVDPVSCSIMPLIEKHIVPLFDEEDAQIYRKLIDKNKDYPTQYKNSLDIYNHLKLNNPVKFVNSTENYGNSKFKEEE